MAVHYLSLITALVLLGYSHRMATALDSCTSDAWGQEFYAGVIGYSANSNHPRWDSYDVYLNILAKEDGQVVVSNNITGMHAVNDVKKGLTYVQLSNSLVHGNPPPLYQRKGIRITSYMNISVSLTMRSGNSFESTLLLPAQLLSTEYIVSHSKDMSVLLVAVEEDTKFNITLTNTDGQHVFSGNLVGFGASYFLNNATSVAAVATIISSNKPIAVFTGQYGSDYNFFEQALPVASWGYQYIVPKLPYNSQTFRSYASQNNTTILTDNTPSMFIEAARGQIRESSMYDRSLVLSSDKPITVELYGPGFMSVLPAISQYRTEYSFVVPDIHTQYTFYTSYVTVIMQNSSKAGIILNDRDVPIWTTKSSVKLNGVEYIVASFQVFQTGYHRITHISPTGRFGAILSATSNSYGYANPLGFSLNIDKPGCTSKPLTTKTMASPGNSLSKGSTSNSEKTKLSTYCSIFLAMSLFATLGQYF